MEREVIVVVGFAVVAVEVVVVAAEVAVVVAEGGWEVVVVVVH